MRFEWEAGALKVTWKLWTAICVLTYLGACRQYAHNFYSRYCGLLAVSSSWDIKNGARL